MVDNETQPPRVCLITGGSDGIGLATAKRFASGGYQIAICGRSKSKLESAAAAISTCGNGNTRCLTFGCDLTKTDDARRFGERVLQEFGSVDVLVNNAALAPLAPFGEIEEEVFEKTISLNIRSVFYLTQAIWKRMMGQRSGVIINMSSLAAIDPFTGFSLYGATKAWIDLLTTALADEGSQYNLRVYSIRPGAVETAMLRGLFPDFPSDQCVSPETVAEKIWDCVTLPDSYISGSHIPVTNQP